MASRFGVKGESSRREGRKLDVIPREAAGEVVALNKFGLAGRLNIKHEKARAKGCQLIQVSCQSRQLP